MECGFRPMILQRWISLFVVGLVVFHGLINKQTNKRYMDWNNEDSMGRQIGIIPVQNRAVWMNPKNRIIINAYNALWKF